MEKFYAKSHRPAHDEHRQGFLVKHSRISD
jgi:hypothetical protein